MIRVTEGQIKADVATELSGIHTLGMAGVGGYKNMLAVLQEMGVKAILLALDADWTTNPHVAVGWKRCIEVFQMAGLTVECEVWDLADGKGIDDLLHAGKRPSIVSATEMLKRIAPMVLKAQPQAIQQATRALQAAGKVVSDAAEAADVEKPTGEQPEEEGTEGDFIAFLTRRAREDVGVLLETATIRALVAMQRTMGPDWVRVKQLAQRMGVWKEIKEAIEVFKDDAKKLGIGVVSSVAPPAAANQIEADFTQFSHFEIGDETIVERNSGYQRVIFKYERGERIVQRYSPITNWSIQWDRIIKQMDEDKQIYQGKIRCNNQTATLQMEKKELVDYRQFVNKTMGAFPTGLITDPGRASLAVQAINSFNTSAPLVHGTASTGYIDGGTTYVMPTVVIQKGHISRNENHFPCFLDGDLAGRYDFIIGSKEEAYTGSELLMDTFINLHDHAVTLPLMAHVLASALVGRLKWHRFPMYEEGIFSSGKTVVARAIANLWADIPIGSGQGGVLSFTGTANSIQQDLHFLRDAPVVMDDVKLETINPAHFFRVLQSMYDSTGRGRLNSDLTRRSEYVARGQVIVTGEEIPPNVASTISRMLILKVKTQHFNPENIDTLDKYRHLLRILTPYWIAWTQTQTAESLQPVIDDLLTRRNRSEMFSRQTIWTLMAFFRFLEETFPQWVGRPELTRYMTEAKSIMIQVMNTTQDRTNAESKEDVFVNALSAAFRVGKAVIGWSPNNTPSLGIPFERSTDEGDTEQYVDILPQLAVDFVSKITKMQFSLQSLGEALRDRGYLAEVRPDGRPSIKRSKRLGGIREDDQTGDYVWRFHVSTLMTSSVFASAQRAQASMDSAET